MSVKIGLEIHEQLKTKTKLFCDCSSDYRTTPNTNICPVCTSQPGSKPNPLNKTALEHCMKIALYLGCRLVTGKDILFLRKHYFYPDLPSNYQRTSHPIGTDGVFAGIRIKEVHLEEDPGRYELREGCVDYNRSGVPLVEIVTEPDLVSPTHAREFLKNLRLALEYLGVVSEESGTMRVDANISVDDKSRVEIKNINSFKGVYQALNSEIKRHKRLIRFGGKIDRETRHWDEKKQITIPLRKKETEADYRYIPDPDIPPINISEEQGFMIGAALPELPSIKQKRFMDDYGIDSTTAEVLVSDPEIADFFEKVAQHVDAKIAASWMKDELKRALNYQGIRLKDTNITVREMSELLSLFQEGILNDLTTRRFIEWFVGKPRSLRKLVSDLGLVKISEKDKLKQLAEHVINKHPQAVNDYLDGKEDAINFLVGKIMAITDGKADPRRSYEILRELIEGYE